MSFETESMERIAFIDGQPLHDYHLNQLQRNVAEGIKRKATIERYDQYLLLSPYSVYFAEDFTSDKYRSSASNAVRNTLTMSIEADNWISVMHELPDQAEEIYIVSKFWEDRANGATVEFAYRTTTNGAWIPMPVDTGILLTNKSRYIQVRVSCKYTGQVRPVVTDYALMYQ